MRAAILESLALVCSHRRRAVAVGLIAAVTAFGTTARDARAAEADGFAAAQAAAAALPRATSRAAPIAVPPTPNNAAALAAKARSAGEVRLIVQLQEPSGRAGGTAASLRQVQQGVLDRVFGTTARAGGPVAGPRNVKLFEVIPFLALTVDAGAVARLAADPAVVGLEEDLRHDPGLTQSVPKINVDDVWARGFTGSGRVVAVLDTGVGYSHPMFSGKLVHEACFSSDDNSRLFSMCPGRALFSTARGAGLNCNTSVSGCTHGTHVASTAVGSMSTLKGVAKDAKLIAVQIFTYVVEGAQSVSTTAFTSDYVRALEYLYGKRNTYSIAAINMSLQGGRFFDFCDGQQAASASIVNRLRSAGIAVVAASGNSSWSDSIAAPACVSNAVAVGNTTKTDGIAPSSNHDTTVDVMAPGTNILAAVPGGFESMTGTSMASPHVAGVFALLKQAKPSATVSDIENALESTGKLVTRAGIAKPRVDVLAALNKLLGGGGGGGTGTTWSFKTTGDQNGWTKFGTWAWDGSELIVGRSGGSTQFRSFTRTTNSASLSVELRGRRIQPAGQTWLSGLFLGTDAGNSSGKASGYFFGLANGALRLQRYDAVSVGNLAGTFFTLCSVNASNIAVGNFHTLKAEKRGSTLIFSVNGTERCRVTDSKYGTIKRFGPAWAFPTNTTTHRFDIDTVTLGGGSAAAVASASAALLDATVE